MGSAGILAERLFRGDERVFLPGQTTHGHHQIEISCDTCHRSRFASTSDLQEACVDCHGAELKRADDSHPKSKFTDPRNADRVALLDARYCVTCHKEHVPEQTLPMGLTLPVDYCYRCHSDIGKERPTHRGLPFDSCASGGCHNFHDNRALYEDFLVAHAGEPWLFATAVTPARDPGLFARHASAPLDAADHDAPPNLPDLERAVADWRGTRHAEAGVNCSDCHVVPSGSEGTETQRAWSDRPGVAGCRECHAQEVASFLESRHGMRVAAGLAPMRPALAVIPMRDDARGELGCATCHTAHAFDTRAAATEACQGCHDDAHTRAFEDSPHFGLGSGEGASGLAAVTCATCHLPRVPRDGAVRVLHNPNDVLRPNEKMIRPVCSHCHGLAFSIDAMADPRLVRANFRGRPERHVESIEMAVGRLSQGEAPTAQPGEEEDDQ